jgi:uncharacterized protein YjbI with pentapeptide repeats
MENYKKLFKKDIIEILKSNAVFKNCIIENINFQFMPSIDNAKFENCLFKSCNFSKTTLRNIRFYQVEFNACWFTGSEISEFEFIKCTYVNCDFSSSVIFNTKFSFCNFCAVYFYSCILTNNSYKNVQFYNTVNFDKSYLSNNLFSNCSLKSGKTTFYNVKYGKENQFKNSSIQPIYIIDEKAIVLLTKYKQEKNKKNDN